MKVSCSWASVLGLLLSFSDCGDGFTVTQRRFQRETVQCASLGKLSTIVIGAACFGVSKSAQVVQQGDVALVERLGKYRANLEPGLHFIIPFVDRVRTRMTNREQVFDIPPQMCITSDNAPLSADAVVYWRVTDAQKATYSVVDLSLAIQNLVLTQIRSEIGKLTLDETFSAREKINAVLLQDLDVATAAWGIKITRVEVRDIIPNREIMQAMELQMAAERTKRANIIKSEGQRESAINAAQGLAESRVIDAKSKAEAVELEANAEAAKLELEAQGVSRALEAVGKVISDPEKAAQFQLTREYIAAQRELATSSNAKIILTADPTSDLLGKALTLYESTQEKGN